MHVFFGLHLVDLWLICVYLCLCVSSCVYLCLFVKISAYFCLFVSICDVTHLTQIQRLSTYSVLEQNFKVKTIWLLGTQYRRCRGGEDWTTTKSCICNTGSEYSDIAFNVQMTSFSFWLAGTKLYMDGSSVAKCPVELFFIYACALGAGAFMPPIVMISGVSKMFRFGCHLKNHAWKLKWESCTEKVLFGASCGFQRFVFHTFCVSQQPQQHKLCTINLNQWNEGQTL